ncbi:MAG: hypothetical protein V1874_16390 [Spirochaetota bacterium]
MKNKIILITLLIFIFSGTGTDAKTEKFAKNVVTITVASQRYDYNAPWQKLAVQREVISGIVLKGNRILTLSYKLADHVLVEVSKFGAYHKYPAKVILKDYHCGLALLTVPDVSFFKDLTPVEFNSEGISKETKLSIVRWDSNGILKEHSADYQKSAVEFFESSGAVLIHQITSEIDSGGKGEPVFVDGALSGITSWYYPNTKTLKAIDIDVVARMLKDFDSGNYKGMPNFFVEDAALENDENLRNILGMESEDNGILINNVPPQTSGSDILKKGDVILNIDGTDLDDNGMYVSEKYGKLAYYGLIYLNHFVGDNVKMNIIRNRKKMEISFALKPFSEDCFLIPTISNGNPPRFYIIGGLVFQELSRDYLQTWGKEWISTVDKRLMYYYDNFTKYPTPDLKRIVILSLVLPSSVNTGYHNYRHMILHDVNGQKIKDINHVKNIIDKSGEKFLNFSFIGGSSVILDCNEAKKSNAEIIQKYKIQSQYYLGEIK